MRYGMLTVIEQRGSYWKVKCDCGVVKPLRSWQLKTRKVSSCGCQKPENLINKSNKHGMSNTSEYAIWKGIKDRCLNSKKSQFPYYGGRGISVCERWLEFKNFYEDMGARPSVDHSIDRIDNDGNYTPENCHWATFDQQLTNRRLPNTTNYYDFRGEMLNLSQISSKTGLDRGRLKHFIARRGYDVEIAIERIRAIDAAKQSGSV